MLLSKRKKQVLELISCLPCLLFAFGGDRDNCTYRQIRYGGIVVKLTSVVGMGVAYVLGAKAGRERYEQLRKWMSAAGDSPAMRDAKRKVKDAASAVAGQARDKAAEGLSNAVSSALGHFVSSSGSGSSSTNSTSSKSRKKTTAGRRR